MLLANEGCLLEARLPELFEALNAASLDELESEGGPAIKLFKGSRAGRLLAPVESGGLGASALDAVRIQRAVGARAPSLAVASTMHHFSLASLMEAARGGDGAHLLLLEAIAGENLLMASGFAEGTTGASVLTPSLSAERVEGGYRLDGAKRPCSLARSMDLLTASVSVDSPVGPELAVAVVPASAEGIEVEPFWNATVLRAAESDAVVLTDVRIAEPQLVRVGVPGAAAVDQVQQAGFVWFELLMTASYLGIAARLVNRVLREERGGPVRRALLAGGLDTCAGAIDAIAAELDREGAGQQLLRRVLLARYTTQKIIAQSVDESVELLGGMAFIRGDSDIRYFAEATRCLAFHPPGLPRAAPALLDSLAGQPLRIV
ncbi:acyl-CoA/acyl-ACP dehydrogenase [Rhodococcus triatomae]|uniref:Acyl-CoA dehydrogenase n=1 Tax=Rhodococcus triatomae TaxID=300028 RepID=A0A1G8NG17_9NOCA|nr:acyl-CoA dehydrogenase family protein [Rhodococcus triatomae]QNG20000.1 acyl-CoA/acyl-ACP dehydrogenase [Rhodococcus triatomae]QNG24085.1 acyl-CoA/acyl-ACP dehydrogenase [Rhodococcus triatomae]SDI79184.1 Acyl-CoA dehydrogenase [Rhodococcus triatomae]